MKISLNSIESIDLRAKCYYDADAGNSYTTIRFEVKLKDDYCPKCPSYGMLETKYVFTSKVCWGHYGKDGAISLLMDYMTRGLGIDYWKLAKKDWWRTVEARCSYYNNIDKLVWND